MLLASFDVWVITAVRLRCWIDVICTMLDYISMLWLAMVFQDLLFYLNPHPQQHTLKPTYVAAPSLFCTCSLKANGVITLGLFEAGLG